MDDRSAGEETMLRALLMPLNNLPSYSCFSDANVGQVEGLKRMGIHCCMPWVHRWARIIASKQEHPTLIQLLVAHGGNRACNGGSAPWLSVIWAASLQLLLSCSPAPLSWGLVTGLCDYWELCGISHPEPPVLTRPPFSAVSTFQARTFHSLPRDGVLL